MYLPALRQCFSPWASVRAFSASLPDALTLGVSSWMYRLAPSRSSRGERLPFLNAHSQYFTLKILSGFPKQQKSSRERAVCCSVWWFGSSTNCSQGRSGAELPPSPQLTLPLLEAANGAVASWNHLESLTHRGQSKPHCSGWICNFLKMFQMSINTPKPSFLFISFCSCSSMKGLAECHMEWESHRENITVAKLWKTPADNS